MNDDSKPNGTDKGPREEALGSIVREVLKERSSELESNSIPAFDESVCWFCSGAEGQAESASALKVPIVKVLERVGNTVRYLNGMIAVPRCKVCAKRHKWRNIISIAAGLLCFFVTVTVLAVVRAIPGGSEFLVMLIGSAGFLIGWGITYKILQLSTASTKRKGYALQHPAALDAREKGWELRL